MDHITTLAEADLVISEELLEGDSSAGKWCLGTAGTFGCPSSASSYGCLT